MDIIKALTIIERKSSIPLDGECFDDIEKAFDIASECINYRVGKRIKPRKCNSCDKKDYINCKDCINCNDDFNRCPTCNEILDDDCSSEPKYCPDCGQALIWNTEDGFSLRG